MDRTFVTNLLETTTCSHVRLQWVTTRNTLLHGPLCRAESAHISCGEADALEDKQPCSTLFTEKYKESD
jgi:hypothetical protein